MGYDYSENILVQESAGNLLRDELGWVKMALSVEKAIRIFYLLAIS